jgi:hypothetical protein
MATDQDRRDLWLRQHRERRLAGRRSLSAKPYRPEQVVATLRELTAAA